MRRNHHCGIEQASFHIICYKKWFPETGLRNVEEDPDVREQALNALHNYDLTESERDFLKNLDLNGLSIPTTTK